MGFGQDDHGAFGLLDSSFCTHYTRHPRLQHVFRQRDPQVCPPETGQQRAVHPGGIRPSVGEADVGVVAKALLIPLDDALLPAQIQRDGEVLFKLSLEDRVLVRVGGSDPRLYVLKQLENADQPPGRRRWLPSGGLRCGHSDHRCRPARRI